MIKNRETTIMRYSSKYDYLILFTGIRVDKLFEYERYRTDECKFCYQNIVLSIESQTWKVSVNYRVVDFDTRKRMLNKIIRERLVTFIPSGARFNPLHDNFLLHCLA